jgi:hypothetical protein
MPENNVFIEDLNTNAYFATDASLRAVGWLEQGHDYRKGTVPKKLLTKLIQHLAKGYQPVNYRGKHACDMCKNGFDGFRNLLIPAGGLLFVAPELILHYMEQHGYRPPDMFIDAVMACPEPVSPAYLELFTPFKRLWDIISKENP